MCKLNLIEINGDIEQFSATYQDCEGAQGVVTITKNGTNYNLIGNNTAGENFETDIEIIEAGINPTKVFKLVAKLLKKYLCPTCS